MVKRNIKSVNLLTSPPPPPPIPAKGLKGKSSQNDLLICHTYIDVCDLRASLIFRVKGLY